jgi:cytochrome P450
MVTHEALGFAPRDPEFVRDPYPVFAQLRREGRALWHEPIGRIFSDRQPLDVWDTFNGLHADSILDSDRMDGEPQQRPTFVLRGYERVPVTW